MNKKVDVKLPYLISSGKGFYFVEYRVFNPKTDKLERFRIYKGFKKCRSFAEVHIHSQKIIAEYKQKLLSGWRPWDDNIYIYEDEIEFRTVTNSFGLEKIDNSHLRKHLSDYLKLKKNDVNKKSYQTYQSKTRLFCLWLENNGYKQIKIHQITNEIVVKFFQHLIETRKLDKVSVAFYKQVIGGMFRYFKSKKLISEIPLQDLPRAYKKTDAAARPITDRDMKAYLKHVAQHDRQLFLASIMQTLLLIRPNKELRLLKIQDIDVIGGRVYINDRNAKTIARVLTMPDALAEIISHYDLHKFTSGDYIFGRGGVPGPVPVGVNYFNRKFTECKTDLGFPANYKFYSLKHTGAGKLLESGATLAELMSHLGHTRFESTIRYVRRHFGEKSEKILNFKPDFLAGLKL